MKEQNMGSNKNDALSYCKQKHARINYYGGKPV